MCISREYLIEDLQVIEDLQKTYGRPTKIGDIYIKSDAILLIGIFKYIIEPKILLKSHL